MLFHKFNIFMCFNQEGVDLCVAKNEVHKCQECYVWHKEIWYKK